MCGHHNPPSQLFHRINGANILQRFLKLSQRNVKAVKVFSSPLGLFFVIGIPYAHGLSEPSRLWYLRSGILSHRLWFCPCICALSLPYPSRPKMARKGCELHTHGPCGWFSCVSWCNRIFFCCHPIAVCYSVALLLYEFFHEFGNVVWRHEGIIYLHFCRAVIHYSDVLVSHKIGF